jgi:hypothetical protein
MPDYIAIHSDPQLLQQARQYAAAQGLSLSRLVTEHLAQLTTLPVNTQRATEVLTLLKKYSQDQLSRQAVMKLLNLDYGELILMMAEHQLPLPSLSESELRPMVTQFVKLWRESP